MPSTLRPRTVISLSGEGVREWLAGLVTQSLAAPVSFGALLSPQGKIIADFFVTDLGEEGLLLDTTEAMGLPLMKRLKMYVLRAPIKVEDVSESHPVQVLWDTEDDDECGHADPRLPALGRRVVGHPEMAGNGDWDAHRLSLGVPDSEWDFGPSSTFPMDACMDQLGGVDYAKGCFVGQEVVSRMKRIGSVRKRMRGLVLSGPVEAGDMIKAGERTVGTVLHVHGTAAMALVRLDRLREASESPTLRGERVQIMDSVLGTDD